MVDTRTKTVYIDGKTILFTGEVVLNCNNGYDLVDLRDNTLLHYKMNDDLPTTNVIDVAGNSDGTFYGENTKDRTTTGKINAALNIISSGNDYRCSYLYCY